MMRADHDPERGVRHGYDGVREVPGDLTAAAAAVALLNLVHWAEPLRGSLPHHVLGIAIALFLPGYVLVAIGFPGAGERRNGAGGADAGSDSWTPSIGERFALSFGTSVVVLPLLGFLPPLLPAGYSREAVVTMLSIALLAGIALAAVRRLRLPREARFHVPVSAWASGLRAAAFEGDRRHRAANVLLVTGVLLAAASFAHAAAVAGNGERYSSFSLVTEDESGELVAGGYPETFVSGQPDQLSFRVANHEGESVTYTVVVELQRLDASGDDARVVERTELDRLRAEVGPGESWVEEHSVAPTTTGEDLRLQYLLYVDEESPDPAEDEPYRELHLWIDVEPSEGSGSDEVVADD